MSIFDKIYSEFKEFPESVEAHQKMDQSLMLQDGPLPPEDRLYLAFKTSEINKNAYCTNQYKEAWESLKSGEPKKILEELAVTLTKEPTQTSWLKGRFLAQGYSEAQWQHAIQVIAYANYSNRLIFAMNLNKT
jgi:alkylhydroperoxidase family enzyme